jgi:DnaK suppressor protein
LRQKKRQKAKPSRGKPKAGKTTRKAVKRARPKSARKSSKKTAKRKQAGKSSARSTKRSAVRKPTKRQGLKIGRGKVGSRAEELRNMLEAKRAEILEEIRRARKDSMETDRTSFAEVGDLVSASVEKERAFEYGEIGVNALREIDYALEKLKEGTYGICELCSKPIGLKRLKVMPSARLCIQCKSQEEASG